MRTAVLACAKLENHYIREWVEHYKKLGFTNVILYDNNDIDGERFEEVIGDYIDNGFVILEDYRGKHKGASQPYAYQDGYNKYGDKYDWFAVFDIDEFLMLNERYKTISDYLSMGMFANCDLIRVPWRMYGDNGLLRVENDDYSLVERFKTPCKKQDRWTKAIIRGGLIGFETEKYNDGPHLVRLKCVKNAVDANGIPVSNNDIRNGCGFENAALNHYSTKTIEEFVLNKKKKGYGVSGLDANIINMDYFFDQNEKTKEKEDLYNELVSKFFKKYSILTYNIGGYELLHEVENASPICEYVYVTDDRSITSSTWNVVYVKNEHPEDVFDLCYKIRFNPFDYVSTDVVIRIDGTMIPCGDTDEIYETFVKGGYDIGLCIHPERCRIDTELSVWVEYRKYSQKQMDRILSYAKENGYDYENYLGLFQCGCMIHKKNDVNKAICEKTLSVLKELHEDGKLVERNDQVVFSYVMNKFYSNAKVLPFSDNILGGAYFRMCFHGTNRSIPTKQTTQTKWMFDTEVEPYVFKKCKCKKKLYYYLWVSPDFETNVAVKIHAAFLSVYKRVFDELHFIVAVDDYPSIGGDVDRAIIWLNSICEGRPYSIRVVDNAKIRESRVILEDLIPMIEKRDNSMVFFAHSKAITDVKMQGRSIESALRWVISMYYYSLGFVDEAESRLQSRAMFGSMLTHWGNEPFIPQNTHKFFYAGNFYWVKPCNIKITNKEFFEKEKGSRFLHEEFPFLIDAEKLSSHNNIFVESIAGNLYNMNEEQWRKYLSYYGNEDEVINLQNRVINAVLEKK